MFKTKNKINIFVFIFLAIILSIVKITMMSSSSENIDIVRSGYLESYKHMTLGEALNGYLESPKWEEIDADDGNKYINITGKCLYLEKEVDVVLQYLIYEDSYKFEYNALEFNGVAQNILVYEELIDNAFEVY